MSAPGKCFNCNGDGRFARECPSTKTNRGGNTNGASAPSTPRYWTPRRNQEDTEEREFLRQMIQEKREEQARKRDLDEQMEFNEKLKSKMARYAEATKVEVMAAVGRQYLGTRRRLSVRNIKGVGLRLDEEVRDIDYIDLEIRRLELLREKKWKGKEVARAGVSLAKVAYEGFVFSPVSLENAASQSELTGKICSLPAHSSPLQPAGEAAQQPAGSSATPPVSPGEANINMHNFPSFSKKALDLEAKIGHGQTPTTDGRKKSLPPNWKAKGRIMFVDNDGSTIELEDDFQAGVGSEAGSVEASRGGVVAASAQKGKATGRRRRGSRSRSQVDRNAPPWEKAGLTEDVWRDRYTRQACIRCGQYGHNQFKCRNKKVTEKIPPTMGQALGSSAPVGSNVANNSDTTLGNAYGLYEFVVMPFGLCNAPGTFQHSMNRIFHDDLDKFVIVYLDDILIFYRIVGEHVAHLDKVLGLLRQHKFKINGETCAFGRTRILYLGHEISAEGLKPDDAKVASIHDWPRPQSVTEMRSFLGMTYYYRNFVKNYSIVAAPLTDLTRLDTPWEWTDMCEAAFRHLKHALTHHEVLKLPDPDKPFIVTTDASQDGIGVVLAQQEGPKLRPVELEKVVRIEKDATLTRLAEERIRSRSTTDFRRIEHYYRMRCAMLEEAISEERRNREEAERAQRLAFLKLEKQERDRIEEEEFMRFLRQQSKEDAAFFQTIPTDGEAPKILKYMGDIIAHVRHSGAAAAST
ncbi:hypothetical protein CBR_g11923 [Chara braunii]|uniref:CCHC-type domain-containing protein n=1 Tax=Chara braunii TaxID=69332 RepID=A0A388KQM2_CHABU|nr:hypothetical protein CBR_g11923 [Chara braunii]|eukprot:GBG72345.1 hypothetical protein CBR_g11923 [Chara braunii]